MIIEKIYYYYFYYYYTYLLIVLNYTSFCGPQMLNERIRRKVELDVKGSRPDFMNPPEVSVIMPVPNTLGYPGLMILVQANGALT